MNVGADGTPGVDEIYLSVDGDAITLRCENHPEFAMSYAGSLGPKVPATWLIDALFAHLGDHVLDDSGGSADEERVAPAAVSAPSLDQFGRRIAELCRWAMDHNEGDPYEEWALEEQLAVALVLGNHLYLEDIGPGPGYTPHQAMFRLFSGMTNKPSNPDGWIAAIRADIRRPSHQERGGLLLPTSDLRVERRRKA